MKALFARILKFFSLSSAPAESAGLFSTLSESKGDAKRVNVYVTGAGGLAEYTNPSSNRETLGLKSVLIRYETGVITEVSVSVENVYGITGVLGTTDGDSEASSYYFSDINANLMPNEKVIISDTVTGEFNATLSFER